MNDKNSVSLNYSSSFATTLIKTVSSNSLNYMRFHKRRGVLNSSNVPDESGKLALTDGEVLGETD